MMDKDHTFSYGSILLHRIQVFQLIETYQHSDDLKLYNVLCKFLTDHGIKVLQFLVIYLKNTYLCVLLE